MMNNFIYLFIFKLIFSSPICKEGSNYCSRCNPITKLCVKCQYDIFIPDNDGGCGNAQRCILGKNNCLQCNEEGNLCQVCEEGYFPDRNGGCSYTPNCEISLLGKCLKCNEGFILIGNNQYLTDPLIICKSLNSDDLKNCEIVNTVKGECEKCKDNFYLNEGDKRCIDIENCFESTFGICDKCIKGYYLDKRDNICKKQGEYFSHCQENIDDKTCNICEDSYYFDEEGKCVDTNFCSKSLNSTCEKCISGYFLVENDKSCTKTEKNCISGKKDIGVCQKCVDGYYLDYKDEICKSNQEDNDFKYCFIADGECIKCIDKYYLGEDKKCSTTKNCAKSNIGTCEVCKDNYYLGLDHKCNAVENCIYTDKYSELDECEECIDNYYYNKNRKTCIKSEGIFKNCKSGYDDMYCYRCKNDFYFNITDKLCYPNNITGAFYKCATTDFNGEYCNSCIDGYFIGYKDHKCSLDDACDMSENENKCLECKFNYCLNNKTGKCIINNKIISDDKKFYYKCLKTNEDETSCDICEKDYTLKNGLCIDDIHCEIKNDQKCEKCLIDYCLNNILGCIDAYDCHCLECNDIFNLRKCDKCMEGYELDENQKCIEIRKN